MYPNHGGLQPYPSAFAAPGVSASAASTSYGHSQSARTDSGYGAMTQPAQLQSASSSGCISALRLRLVDDFRIDPPIPMSAAFMALSAHPPATTSGSTHGTNGVTNLSLEQQLVDETRKNDVEEYFKSTDPARWQDDGVRQFTDMGYTRAQASLGLAFCSAFKLNQSEVPEFASNFNQLASMGYDATVAAGVLAKTKNDLNAATEMALALS